MRWTAPVPTAGAEIPLHRVAELALAGVPHYVVDSALLFPVLDGIENLVNVRWAFGWIIVAQLPDGVDSMQMKMRVISTHALMVNAVPSPAKDCFLTPSLG